MASASNVNDGITLAVELKPDVILIDGVMPEISGTEAVRRARSLDTTERSSPRDSLY